MSSSRAPGHPAERKPAARHCFLTSRMLGLAAITALTLVGCGPGAGSGQPAESSSSTETGTESMSPTAPQTSSSSSSEPAAEPPVPAEREGNYTAELAITVVPQPGVNPVNHVLACNGTEPSEDSNVPDPAAACELLQNSAEALFFTKADPTLQCTQQFGGPQTATISGTIDGRPVDGSFSLSDGCEIDRWNTLAPLLGPGGAM